MHENGMRIEENSPPLPAKPELEWVDAELKRWKSGSQRILLLSVDTGAKLTPETHMQMETSTLVR